MAVNHGVLCWASGCETLCVMLSSVCRNHGVLCWASRCESLRVMLSQWSWIMMCYSVPVGVSHGELCWARGWQSCCIILSQCCESLWAMLRVVVNHGVLWLTIAIWTLCQLVWILLCYTEPLVVNDCELCWTSGCESWCVILSQWLWIMVSYAEPVVANHVVLCCASGCG